MTIRDLIIQKQSYLVEKVVTIGGEKFFYFIEALDKNGCSFVCDFNEKKLTEKVLVEIGIVGSGETFATLNNIINIWFDFDRIEFYAIEEVLKHFKEKNQKTIQKYLEYLGWGFETETPLTNYDELRNHLDQIEKENPHLTYWDYPIEEVLDRIQNNEVFFCIGGRMFETHTFMTD